MDASNTYGLKINPDFKSLKQTLANMLEHDSQKCYFLSDYESENTFKQI